MENFRATSNIGNPLSAVPIPSFKSKRAIGIFAKPTLFIIEKERANFIFPIRN